MAGRSGAELGRLHELAGRAIADPGFDLSPEDRALAQSALDHANLVDRYGVLSTPQNDATETLAIKQVFGDRAYELVVGSTKSMTGHTLGAAGAIEGAISALVCQRGLIPPTINFEEADPECDLDYAHHGPVEKDVRVAITNSFGFGGHNVCLVFRKWTE